MKIQLGDMIMHGTEMMKVVTVTDDEDITLEWEWLDDITESHHFGPFKKDEYRDWPVL